MSADAKSDVESVLGSIEVKKEGGRSLDAATGADGTDLDGAELRALSEAISRDFAPQLEHTALVLFDRDPEHLQAQWYVTPEELAQARSLSSIVSSARAACATRKAARRASSLRVIGIFPG